MMILVHSMYALQNASFSFSLSPLFSSEVLLILGGGICAFVLAYLFTFGSLRSTLINNGYDIIEQRGIPAPFPLALGNGPAARFLLALNNLLMMVSKGLEFMAL